MSFRLKVIDGDSEFLTPWYQELNSQAAPYIVTGMRQQYPDAKIATERKNIRHEKTINADTLRDMLRDARRKSGWTEEEIADAEQEQITL